jgi:hypothetical protein
MDQKTALEIQRTGLGNWLAMGVENGVSASESPPWESSTTLGVWFSSRHITHGSLRWDTVVQVANRQVLVLIT